MMVCEQCGREFESKRDTARYCSPACRVKASRVSVTDSPLSVTVSVTVSVTKPLSVTQETVTVKVAGQAIELGKPYSTDKDNRLVERITASRVMRAEVIKQCEA